MQAAGDWRRARGKQFSVPRQYVEFQQLYDIRHSAELLRPLVCKPARMLRQVWLVNGIDIVLRHFAENHGGNLEPTLDPFALSEWLQGAFYPRLIEEMTVDRLQSLDLAERKSVLGAERGARLTKFRNTLQRCLASDGFASAMDMDLPFLRRIGSTVSALTSVWPE